MNNSLDPMRIRIGMPVVYNGGTQSYYGCSDPSELITGATYRVRNFDIRNFQTNIFLEGIQGSFNSIWFSKPELATFFAFAKKEPKVSEMLCNSITAISLKNLNDKIPASIIREVSEINILKDLYFIKTDDANYLAYLTPDISTKNNVYFGFSLSIPVAGNRLTKYLKWNICNNNFDSATYLSLYEHSSTILFSNKLLVGNNVYLVRTRNSIYIIKKVKSYKPIIKNLYNLSF